MLFFSWPSEIVNRIGLLGVTALNPSYLGFTGIAFCMRVWEIEEKARVQQIF